MAYLLIGDGWTCSFPSVASIAKALKVHEPDVRLAIELGDSIRGYFVDVSLEKGRGRLPVMVKALEKYDEGMGPRSVMRMFGISYAEAMRYKDAWCRINGRTLRFRKEKKNG